MVVEPTRGQARKAPATLRTAASTCTLHRGHIGSRSLVSSSVSLPATSLSRTALELPRYISSGIRLLGKRGRRAAQLLEPHILALLLGDGRPLVLLVEDGRSGRRAVASPSVPSRLDGATRRGDRISTSTLDAPLIVPSPHLTSPHLAAEVVARAGRSAWGIGEASCSRHLDV